MRQLTLFESFYDGLLKLEDAGLDVVSLCQFYRDNDWQDFRWPDEALEEFFVDKLSQIGPYPGPLRHSFFKRMGILESHLDDIVHEFETLEVPEDPLGFLMSTFESVAGPLNLAGGSVEGPSTGPGTDQETSPHDENLAAFLAAHAQSVAVKVQKSCPTGSTDKPCYEEMGIPIIEGLPIGPGYLYHTTKLESGVKIVEKGPFVPYSRVAIDFDGGFYVNDDRGESEKWALRCINNSIHKLAVTLVYKPTVEFWGPLNIYQPDPSAWSAMVKAFRTNNHLMIDLERYLNYDVVIGLKVRNPTARLVMACNEAWDPIPYSNQIVFTDPPAAHQLKKYLYAIMIHRPDKC